MQENITHPNKGFYSICQLKSVAFECSNIDVGATIFFSNVEKLERKRILEESITHPKTVFAAFVNKGPALTCSINDVDTSIFFQNAEKFERKRILQESMIDTKTVFAAFVNKVPALRCSINDVGTTIFF